MTESPEGRCAVCRVAWDPCRKCRGEAIRAKQEETMARNGTSRPLTPDNFGAITLKRDPSLHKHEVSDA